MTKIYFPKDQQLNLTTSLKVLLKKPKNVNLVGWGEKMFSLFKLVAFINRYGLVRHHFLYPPGITAPWGHLIGLFLGWNKSTKRQIRASMEAFFPKKSPKRIAQLTRASLTYFGTSFLNLIFNLPLTGYPPYMKLFEFENIEILDAAYTKAQKMETGVILVVTHTADFVHYLPGIGQHPRGYKTVVIGNLSNSPIYQYLIARPGFKDMIFYPSISFRKIGPMVEKRLKEGRILIHYSDYSQRNQLRVPMWEGQYPYLVHTLQSGVRLHKKTGSIIVPCFAYPDRSLGRVVMKIVDNTEIMETSHRYWDAPAKEFHGRMSTVINKVMYKYIRPVAHCWEEIMNFAKVRLADRLYFPPKTKSNQMLTLIHQKLLTIIDHSWEPDRDDNLYITHIDTAFSDITSKLKEPDLVIFSYPRYIDLSQMDGSSELQKICRIANHCLKEAGEDEVARIFDSLRLKFI